MLRQAFYLLSAITIAAALGDGKPFHSKKNVFQNKAPQQYASVASYHSNQPSAPQFQPAAAPQPQAAPSPYSFGYEAEGSARQESSDANGKVTGSYTVTNEDGTVRVVKYIADENGFRADIDTNEAGTKSSNPANVDLKSAFVEPAAPAPKKYAAPQAQAAPKMYAAPQAYAGSSSHKGQYEQKPIQFNMANDGGSYSYKYEAQLEDGGSNSHSESSDASGKMTGQYSLSVADGRRRQVEYSSGNEGFQAKIDTNEFGTKSDAPANVQFYSSAAQQGPAPATASFAKTSSFQQQAQVKHYSAAPVQQQPIQATKFSTSPIKQQPIQNYAQYDSKPSPYAFSYNAQLDDGSSSRTESSDASGKVIGSYSLSDADGRKRTIEYVADHEGFRATVNTNEFGTKSDSPADAQFYSSAPEEAPAAPSAYKTSQYSQKPIPAAFPVEQSPLKAAFQSGSASSSQFKSSSSYQGQSAIQYNNAAAIEAYAPFAFNYIAELEDGSSSRTESGDGSGKVIGSYSLSNQDGRKRTVDYSADQGGFKATVNTNEFGTKSDSPADVQFYSSAAQEAPAAPARAAPFGAAPAQAAFKPADAGGHYQYAASPSQYKANFNTQQRVEAEPSYQPSPYSFNYQADATGGSSARSESSDASGTVTGSYTVQNEDGSLRVVEYIADKDGFRANVKTNEPGTKSDDPADVMFKSDAPAYTAPAQQQPKQQPLSKANFPAHSYTPKSSMVSQKAIDAWSR